MTSKSRASALVAGSEEMPRVLRQCIVRLMAEKDLDWTPACEAAAILLDGNGKAFKNELQSRANDLYKSRFMSEMNKARGTMKNEAQLETIKSYNKGWSEGFAAGKTKYEIAYRCSICDKPMTMVPMGEDHKAMVQLMFDKGWGHKACHEKDK
jgi:hypothetical protein